MVQWPSSIVELDEYNFRLELMENTALELGLS